MSGFLFPKEERLKSSKTIARLFREGNSEFSYPIKFVFVIQGSSIAPGIKVAVSVSGKKFKRAVDRNIIKRRLREAFRMQKSELLDELVSRQILIEGMFIYVANDIVDYQTIAVAMKKILTGLSKETMQYQSHSDDSTDC